MNANFIDISSFKNSMSDAIVLDCRLLREYEKKKIKNSIHITCRDKITKKRLETNKLSVKDLISSQEIKKKLENCCNNEILLVLYDEETNDENDLFSNQNPLQLVLDNIKSTLKNVKCKILKGGFKEFIKECQEYCVQNEDKYSRSRLFDYNSEEKLEYEIKNAKLTKILDYLYIGNECDAKNEELLIKENITHIINVTKTLPCYHEGSQKRKFEYLRIPINDGINKSMNEYFEETSRFIDEARIKNGKVLVHCQAGISRSPTIVIAYLMKIKNLTHDSAYHLVKSKRGIIEPNIFFVSQLFDFEKTL